MTGKDFILEQLNHEPTKNWLDVIGKYAFLSKYQYAIDIGTGSGLSAYSIAQNGKGMIFSMDVKLRPIAKLIAGDFDYDKRINFYEMTSDSFFREVDMPKPDFIVIDGSHDYDDVKNDLLNSFKILNKGGYIVCDDYERYNGTRRAIIDFAKENGKNFIEESGKAIFHE